MHLQAAIEDFDVFARSLSIGAETMVMRFEPDRPMRDRYQVEHGFLSPTSVGDRHRLATRERVLPLGSTRARRSSRTGRAPIDYANASPDVAIHVAALLLPVGDARARALDGVRLVTGRQMRIDLDPREYFAIGDREDLSYDEKLRAYRGSPTSTSRPRATRSSSRSRSALDELTVDYFEAPSSTISSCRSSARRSPSTSRSTSSSTTAGSSAAWAADQRAPA